MSIYDELFGAYERASAMLAVKESRLANAGWRRKIALRRQIKVLRRAVDELAIELVVARMRGGICRE